MPENRKVEVKLDLSMGQGGYKLLDDLKGSISKAAAFASDLREQTVRTSQAARRLSPFAGFKSSGVAPPSPASALPADTLAAVRNIGLGGFAARVGTAQAYGQAASELGFGRAGALLSRAAVPLAVAGTVASGAQSIAGVVHDPYLTSGQAGRQLFREVVPGGERIQRFIDDISGRRFEMEQADIRAQRMGLNFQRQQQIAGFQLGYNPQQAFARERAAQLQRAEPVLLPEGIERGTALGEREFREQSRLLGVRREIARLERDQSAATKSRVATEVELGKIASRENDLLRQRAALQSKVNRDQGSGPERLDLLRRLDETNKAVESITSQRREAEQAAVASRVREAEAAGASRRARAQELEERAGIQEERVGAFREGAQRIGSSRPQQLQFALAAIRAARTRGFANLPPQMQAAAQQYFPGVVAELTERAGRQSPFASAFERESPTEYGDVNRARREAQDLRNRAERERLGAEADIATATQKAGERLGEAVIREINRAIDATIRKIEDNKKIERSQK